MCREHDEAAGSFPQHQRGAGQEVRAITKTKGKLQGAPVWRLLALKAHAGFCLWEKQPLKSISDGSLLNLLRHSHAAERAVAASLLVRVQKSRVGFSMFSPFTVWFSHTAPQTPIRACCPWGAFPSNFVQGWNNKAWPTAAAMLHFSSKLPSAIFSAGGQWNRISIL